jgi:integrase
MESRVRELALFNLGIDSKLRGCDLVSLKVRDVSYGDQVATRAVVMQHKTQRTVQFEITPVTREAVQKWIKQSGLKRPVYWACHSIAEPGEAIGQYARLARGRGVWRSRRAACWGDFGIAVPARTRPSPSTSASMDASQLLLVLLVAVFLGVFGWDRYNHRKGLR